MKIVLLVDYSSKEFNRDFSLSNTLIAKGHNVFLAVNDNQFNDFAAKCDRVYLGLSACNRLSDYPNISVIDDNINI